MKITKSPTAPSRTLKYCMDMALKVYSAYGHSEFTAAELASAVGQSSTSGPFRSSFSALKQYGLIEKTSQDSFRVAQAVKDYEAIPSSESERLDALRYELVALPSLFSTLLDKLGGRLPTSENLASILGSQYGFNKAKASEVARAFCDSLEWCHALDSKRNIVPPRIGQTASNEELVLHEGERNADEQQRKGTNDATAGFLTIQIPLESGRIAELHYPHDLNVEEAQRISNVLDALFTIRK